MFAWLVAVHILLLNGRVVLQGVHCAPPDGGLVHVLLIRQPDVQSVGVIELAAEGHLTLMEVVRLAHLNAVKQVRHPVEEGLCWMLRLSECPTGVSDEAA